MLFPFLCPKQKSKSLWSLLTKEQQEQITLGALYKRAKKRDCSLKRANRLLALKKLAICTKNQRANSKNLDVNHSVEVKDGAVKAPNRGLDYLLDYSLDYENGGAF